MERNDRSDQDKEWKAEKAARHMENITMLLGVWHRIMYQHGRVPRKRAKQPKYNNQTRGNDSRMVR